MAFKHKQYDIVLLDPPPRVIKERWDMPDFPHIGLAYIGNYLEHHKGITPAIVDGKLAQFSPNQTVEEIVHLNPKIIGVTAMTHMIVDAALQCEKIKEQLPDVKIIAGGFHPTFLPEQTIKEFPVFDFIVVGEGEIAFSELIEALLEDRAYDHIPGLCFIQDDRIKSNGRSILTPTLDEFGEAGWHLFDPDIMREKARSLNVMTMRGCPFSCNFCSRPYGQKVRRRTPRLVVDEIERGVNNFGITHFYFNDETFTVDKRHTIGICNELIERGLSERVTWVATMHANTADLEMIKTVKKAGCVRLTFGVESGNHDIMAAMKKNITKERVIKAARLCQEAGMDFDANFIIGHPHETFRTALDSIILMVKLNAVESPIGVMVPYPGTEIWDMAVKGEGGYKAFSHNWDDFGKQGGRAVELTTMPSWMMQTMALAGYLSLYIFNLRFRELFQIAWKERRLVIAMLKQITYDITHRFKTKSTNTA